MPYKIAKCGDQYCKVKKSTGKVVSHHASKRKAAASIRAYYANRMMGK